MACLIRNCDRTSDGPFCPKHRAALPISAVGRLARAHARGEAGEIRNAEAAALRFLVKR